MPGTPIVLIFQVDLFSARGALPRDMHEVLGRQKDIQYSSRTRMVTDILLRQHKQNRLLKRTLDQVPERELDDEQMAEKMRLSEHAAIHHPADDLSAGGLRGAGEGFRVQRHVDARALGRRVSRHQPHAAPTGRGSRCRARIGGIAVHDVHRRED